MATITDSLETVLKLTGGPQYAAGMKQAATSVQNLATQQKKLSGGSPGGGGGGGGFSLAGMAAGGFPGGAKAAGGAAGGLGNIAGMAGLLRGGALVAGITATAVAIRAAMQPFVEFEQAAFRMQVVFKNIGRAAEIPAMEQFSRLMASVTGNTQAATLALTAILAESQFTEQQIKRAIPTLSDFAAATGLDLAQAADIVTAATRGERDALQRYGVDVGLAGTKTELLNKALSGLEARFKGAAEAAANTLPGALTRLNNSFNELLVSMNRLFSGALVAAIQTIDKAIQGWSMFFNQVGDFLGRPRTTNAAQNIGIKGDPKQTALLGQIAANTAKLDPFLKSLLTGKGAIAEQAFSRRDARMAFGV